VGLLGPFGPPLPCCTRWGPSGPHCRAVHDGALRAPIARGTTTRPKTFFFIWQPTKKKLFFKKKFLPVPVPVASAGAGDADPENKKYIAKPFICHLRERSVTTQS